MEKIIYWIKRILHKKWKQCRSFCGVCQYYSNCKNDEENETSIDIKPKEMRDVRSNSDSVVI